MSLPRSLRLLLATLAAALSTAASAQLGTPAAASAVVKTEQARAELLAQAPEGVSPGQPVWVGLQIAHQPHWHTYWKNAGDSGLPTQLEWTLPPGVQAGEIAWPTPKKLTVGPLVNYGYEGTVLLPVPLTITPDFKPPLLGQDLTVKLRASWLICRTECIPEEGEFTLRIPLKGSTALNGAAFEAARQAAPVPLAAQADSGARVEGQTLHLAVAGLPASLRGKTLDAFPETTEVINPSAPWKQAWQGAVWTAELPLLAQRSASPRSLPVVLTHAGQGWRAELAVSGTGPPPPPPAGISPALQAALDANAAAPASAPSLTFYAALLGALLAASSSTSCPACSRCWPSRC
jgi:thiol:disulfide interchange protein DsbD